MAQAQPHAAALGPVERDPPGVIEPVRAPWIRPGVVVHHPDEAVDGLLAQFALTLKDRGFHVTGYVQSNNRGCSGRGEGCAPLIDYFDLATRETLSVERGAATRYLRRAMREDADLLVISRFSACVEATESIRAAVGGDATQGMPLLTSIAGQCVHKWHSYARHEGAMISPDPADLWVWWGPENLYRDLALGVDADEVRRIVCGGRWVMVEGEHGAGLAHLPRHPRELIPRIGALTRLSLRGLADLSRSWDPLETAVGIAALNAHYNRFDLAAKSGNGVKTLRQVDGTVAVVGAFPGLEGILPRRQVIEAEPRPGEFPIVAMETLLPHCAAAVVNSSALVNRALPRILRLTRRRPTAVIGPATPLTPRLHDYGVAVLGGLVVNDPNGLASAIRAGARPADFTRFGRYVHLAAL